jgi:hypothetical protein
MPDEEEQDAVITAAELIASSLDDFSSNFWTSDLSGNGVTPNIVDGLLAIARGLQAVSKSLSEIAIAVADLKDAR